MSGATTYQVEYALSARSKCKAGKSCPDPAIAKGALRLGSTFDNGKSPMTSWRHWTCISGKVLESIGDVENLSGLDKLTSSDQLKVRESFKKGSVKNGAAANNEADESSDADADAPITKAAAPKRGRGRPRKTPKPKAEEDEDGDVEPTEKGPASPPKPKRKRGRPKKKVAGEADD